MKPIAPQPNSGADRPWSEQDRVPFEAAATTLRSVLERASHLLMLNTAAMTDVLTGLKNRRASETDLQSEEERARRQGQPLGLMMLDFDGLKAINDFQGYAQGDALIRTFGEVLRKRLRSGDQVYRLGGDEFAALLNGLTDGVKPFVEAKVRQAEQDPREQGFPSSGVSVALAFHPEKAETPDVLMRLVDDRMYSQKGQRKVGMSP